MGQEALPTAVAVALAGSSVCANAVSVSLVLQQLTLMVAALAPVLIAWSALDRRAHQDRIVTALNGGPYAHAPAPDDPMNGPSGGAIGA